MKQSGYTLIELTWWGALSSILFASILSISAQLRRADRTAADYVSDLADCRRALRSVEWDVRLARRVETTTTSIRIHGAAESVDYVLRGGVLTRSAAGTHRIVARRVRTLTVIQDGRTVAIRLVLLSRRRDSAVREAAIHSCVMLPPRHGGRP